MPASGPDAARVQSASRPKKTQFYVPANNARLRKIIRTRGPFPSDDAATKLNWLALKNITADWSRSAREWTEAMNQFAIAYADQFTRNFG